jgi:hypothetical protein
VNDDETLNSLHFLRMSENKIPKLLHHGENMPAKSDQKKEQALILVPRTSLIRDCDYDGMGDIRHAYKT